MQAGQPITFNGTSANRKIVDLESIASSNPLTITASKLTVSGDVDIQGVLNTVTGTETVFEDTILVLNQSDTSGTVANTSAALVSGIEINRSGTVESSLKWEEAIQLWKLRGGNGLEVVGDGGNIGITTNDSQGNANITFNHARGDADQDGNAGRIEVNVDRSGGEVAYMDFEVGDNVAQGTTALYPTLRLRDNGAIVNRPTLEIDNNLWIDGGVGSGRGAAQSLDTAYSLMKGQIRFDNTHSDTARGPNKIVMHDVGGGGTVSGIGISAWTFDSYSTHDFRWNKMLDNTITENMKLDRDGNLEVTGKMTIGTGPTDALDVATKQYVDDAAADATMSAANILTSLKGVDGTGSGLDADLLDGLQATSFLRADTADTLGGRLTVTPAGGLNFQLSTAFADSATTEQHDFMKFGTHGSLSQISKRGALMLTSSDDSLVLAAGDVGRSFNNTHLDADGEGIYLINDGDIFFKTNLQDGWTSGNVWTYTFGGGQANVNGPTGQKRFWHEGNLPVTVAKDGNGDTVYTFDALP